MSLAACPYSELYTVSRAGIRFMRGTGLCQLYYLNHMPHYKLYAGQTRAVNTTLTIHDET